jgi:hypothetical protein
MTTWDRGYWGPDYPSPAARWGNECARGIAYKTTGAPVTDGTAGQVRKISSGRKERGMASDDYRGPVDGTPVTPLVQDPL